MKEGFYSIVYQGTMGFGFGMLALDTGVVVGADVAGGTYDGSYAFNPMTNSLDIYVEVSIPAGVSLVQGIAAQPDAYTFPVSFGITRDLGKEQPVTIPTPYGNVAVVLKKIRDFPS